MVPAYFLIFLFPLGVYLLLLAIINRRERPVMISGIWDALLLSFAMSGILLWVGPALLGAFYQRGIIPGSAEQANRSFEQIWALYPWIWIGYYILVLTGQALMIASRRDKTVVYNVDAAALEQIVARAIAEMGYRVSLGHGSIVFEKPREGAPAAETGGVFVEPFAPLRHATLHWHTNDSILRMAVERDVAARLGEAATAENPSVSWLLGISGLIFGFVFLGAVFLILIKLLPWRNW